MVRLIDKDALLAEIERLVNNQDSALDYEAALEDVRNFIDNLEVKEVDLDSERKKYLTEHFNVYEDGILQSKRSNLSLDTYDVIKIAKHFFELGMKVSNKEQKGEKV